MILQGSFKFKKKTIFFFSYLQLLKIQSYVRRDAFFSLLNLKNTHNIPLSLLEMDVDPAVIISLLKELPNQKYSFQTLFRLNLFF